MSPGYAPRPSLSEENRGLVNKYWFCVRAVSPGYAPRPSLSAIPFDNHERRRPGVAGVCAPAFVERDQ